VLDSAVVEIEGESGGGERGGREEGLKAERM